MTIRITSEECGIPKGTLIEVLKEVTSPEAGYIGVWKVGQDKDLDVEVAKRVCEEVRRDEVF